MEYQEVSDSQLVVRIARGEMLVESIKKLVTQQKIESGGFYGLGAIENFELAYYDLVAKKYLTKKFIQSYELTNVSGNCSWLGDDLVVHAHATLAGRDYSVVGGHLIDGQVSGTVELVVDRWPVRLTRKKDEEVGLALMDLR